MKLCLKADVFLNQIVSAVFGFADDALRDEMVKGLGAMLSGAYP